MAGFDRPGHGVRTGMGLYASQNGPVADLRPCVAAASIRCSAPEKTQLKPLRVKVWDRCCGVRVRHEHHTSSSLLTGVQ
jgi:hypothetical protein